MHSSSSLPTVSRPTLPLRSSCVLTHYVSHQTRLREWGCLLLLCYWTPTGICLLFYPDIIWVILQVSEDGLLDITQEMSRFGSGLGIPVSKSQDKEAYNPFSTSNVSSMNSVANEHSTSLQSTTLNSPSHHGAASSLEAQSANSNHPVSWRVRLKTWEWATLIFTCMKDWKS